MNARSQWTQRQARLGYALLIAGALLLIVSLLLPALVGALPFNPRIIGGLGILLLGLGFARLVRYNAARKDEQAARRLMIEETDERTRLLRDRSGNRAYWVSTVLAYALLMWLSFAANGSLPTPDMDTLWYALAAVVVLPFIVYAAGLVYDQQHE